MNLNKIIIDKKNQRIFCEKDDEIKVFTIDSIISASKLVDKFDNSYIFIEKTVSDYSRLECDDKAHMDDIYSQIKDMLMGDLNND